MSIDFKINKLRTSIITDFSSKIDELLNSCESPIERLLLLHLYDHFTSHQEGYNLYPFSIVEFIVENINDPWLDDKLSDSERKQLENKIERYKYRHTGFDYEKIVGFKCYMNMSEDVDDINSIVFRKVIIRPQYEVKIDNLNCRIDIAILLERVKNEKVIETRKIALECDGYEFHTSKEQKLHDDVRTRKLMSKGWKVMRYSGTELYNINGDFAEKFKEIMDVFYA